MNTPTELQQRLEAEVMEVEFDALRPHVARDAVVWIAPDLPLVKAAMAVSLDATDDLKAWMASGQVVKLTAGDSIRYAQDRFRFVIVQPFVLIQPLGIGADGA